VHIANLDALSIWKTALGSFGTIWIDQSIGDSPQNAFVKISTQYLKEIFIKKLNQRMPKCKNISTQSQIKLRCVFFNRIDYPAFLFLVDRNLKLFRFALQHKICRSNRWINYAIKKLLATLDRLASHNLRHLSIHLSMECIDKIPVEIKYLR